MARRSPPREPSCPRAAKPRHPAAAGVEEPRHAVRFGAAGGEFLTASVGRRRRQDMKKPLCKRRAASLFLASKRAFPQVRRYEEAIQPKYALSLSKDIVLEKADSAILWKRAR